MGKQPHQRKPDLASIPLRGLFGNFDESAFKLHCAVVNEQQIQPIDVLANDWDEWVGWSRWRGAVDHFKRDFVFHNGARAQSRRSMAIRRSVRGGGAPTHFERALL